MAKKKAPARRSRKTGTSSSPKVLRDGSIRVVLEWSDGKTQEVLADVTHANLLIDDVISRHSQGGSTCTLNSQFFADVHDAFKSGGILPENATLTHSCAFYRDVQQVWDDLKKNMQ